MCDWKEFQFDHVGNEYRIDDVECGVDRMYEILKHPFNCTDSFWPQIMT